MMKRPNPKNSPDPVSRPSNEEIETDENGRLISAGENYAGNADEPTVDADEESVRRKYKPSNLGIED